jgi:hypothetical protein
MDAAVGDMAAAAEKARFARLAAMEADLQAKRDDLAKAQAAANVPGKNNLPFGHKGDEAFAAGQAAEIRGTFSGAVAAMLGGGVAKQQLDVLYEVRDNITKVVTEIHYTNGEWTKVSEAIKNANLVM